MSSLPSLVDRVARALVAERYAIGESRYLGGPGWDEKKHPRVKSGEHGGEFTKTGGEGAAAAPGQSLEERQQTRKRRETFAAALDKLPFSTLLNFKDPNRLTGADREFAKSIEGFPSKTSGPVVWHDDDGYAFSSAALFDLIGEQRAIQAIGYDPTRELPAHQIIDAYDRYKKEGTRSPYFKNWFGDWEADPQHASKVVDEETGEPKEEYPHAKMVYHGTQGQFEAFDPGTFGGAVVGEGFYFAENHRISRQYAQAGGRELECYLNIRKPYDFDARYGPEVLEAITKVLTNNQRFGAERALFFEEMNDQFNAGIEEKWPGAGTLSGRKLWKQLAEQFGRRHVNELLAKSGLFDGLTHIAMDEGGTDTAAMPGSEPWEHDKEYYGRCWVAFNNKQIKLAANRGTFDPEDPRMAYARPGWDESKHPRVGAGQETGGQFTSGQGGGGVAKVTQPRTRIGKPGPQHFEITRTLRERLRQRRIARAGKEYDALGPKAPTFKAWFGDWEGDPSAASKVVDPQTGEPQEQHEIPRPVRVYHGTRADFESFDPQRQDPEALYGGGFYFTTDPEVVNGKFDENGRLGRPGYRQANMTLTPEQTQAVVQQLQAAPVFRRMTGWDDDVQLFAEHAGGGKIKMVDLARHFQTKYHYHLYGAMQDAGIDLGGTTQECYLNIRKPFDIDNDTITPAQLGFETAPWSQAQKDQFNQFQQAVSYGTPEWQAQAPAMMAKLDEEAKQTPWNWKDLVFWGHDTGNLGHRDPNNPELQLGVANHLNQMLRKAGYDGITHVGGANWGWEPHRVWIAFQPTQVKATANRGTFDPNDPRMRYAAQVDRVARQIVCDRYRHRNPAEIQAEIDRIDESAVKGSGFTKHIMKRKRALRREMELAGHSRTIQPGQKTLGGWDESKHPRDEGGKFSEGQGGGEPAAEPAPERGWSGERKKFRHPTHGFDAVKMAQNLTMHQLQELREDIEKDPENRNRGLSFSIFTKPAKKKLEALAWAITYKLQKIKENSDRIRKEITDAADANIKAAGDSKAIKLASPEVKNSYFIVGPSPAQNEQGKWRLWTLGADGTPWGHQVFESRENAIRSASGESSEGPPVGERDVRVVDRRARFRDRFAVACYSRFVESEHPREPAGTGEGGQFTSKPGGQLGFAFEDSPRGDAGKATEADQEDYIYARESAIPNAGEDILESARHKLNAWRGLEHAEEVGTAGTFVKRDMLLKVEPPDLITSADKNPLTALAMYFALKALPPAPGYKGKAGKKDREQYLDAYRRMKSKAEELAKTEPDPKKATRSMYDEVLAIISRLRMAEPNLASPTATALYSTYRLLADWGGRYGRAGGHNRVTSKMNDFAQRSIQGTGIDFRTEQDIERKREYYAKMTEAVKRVIEGESVDKALGVKAEPGEKTEGVKAADLYVNVAERTGGRSVPSANAQQTTTFLTDRMKMRGVQFGNSVTDDERLHHLTKAAEAFADLADVVGLPLEGISHQGQLGIAFGARGHGSALAHYEPVQRVINLTRKKGVGSLAHEWGHFIDNMAANDLGNEGSESFLSSTRGKSFKKDAEGHYVPQDISEDPLYKRMADLKTAMKTSGYNDRLHATLQSWINKKRMSPDRAKDYWESNIEKLARCFERFVQRKLENSGRKNTYLAGFRPYKEDDGSGFWPLMAEVDAMTPAFDGLFNAIRSKKYPGKTRQQILEENAKYRRRFIDDFTKAYYGRRYYDRQGNQKNRQRPRPAQPAPSRQAPAAIDRLARRIASERNGQ